MYFLLNENSFKRSTRRTIYKIFQTDAFLNEPKY